MATKWYYKVMGVENGPVTSEELLALAVNGQIAPDALVRTYPPRPSVGNPSGQTAIK